MSNARPPMTVKEAAEYLQVSTKTIRNLCKRRLIRYSSSLRVFRLNRDDVEKFIERTSGD
jgi:excisionase family DNA binding protein